MSTQQQLLQIIVAITAIITIIIALMIKLCIVSYCLGLLVFLFSGWQKASDKNQMLIQNCRCFFCFDFDFVGVNVQLHSGDRHCLIDTYFHIDNPCNIHSRAYYVIPRLIRTYLLLHSPSAENNHLNRMNMYIYRRRGCNMLWQSVLNYNDTCNSINSQN